MVAGAQVSFRDAAGRVSTCDLSAAEAAMVAAGRPWRVFRWRQGQTHYSGWYWSSTTRGHVVYESRLELARLLLADFDPTVVAIAAQPFVVTAPDAGRVRRHVPDFLLVDSDGLVSVVNVKPSGQLGEPRIAAALDWAGKVFAERGWRHEVWSTADPVVLANVRFLAAYRHSDRVTAEAVAEIKARFVGTASVGAVEEALADRFGAGTCRPAVLHLVWQGVFRVGLGEPLSSRSLLERAA